MLYRFIRGLLALGVAAGIPAAIAAGYTISIDHSEPLFATWLVFFVPGFLAAIILGIPLTMLARRFHLLRWWTAVPSGFLIGCAAISVLIHQGPNGGSWNDIEKAELFAGTLGAVGGFAGWAVLRLMRRKSIYKVRRK